MTLRGRLLVLLLAIYILGGLVLGRWIVRQVRPRYLESVEQTLVDSSVLLATSLESQLTDGRLDPAVLDRALSPAQRRHFTARIFSLEKTAVDLRVYITDASGRVVYDSTGKNVGRDYSAWKDVARTLRGEYGARSSRDRPGDDDTQVIYVAAPILYNERIIGVLALGEQTAGVNQLVNVAQSKLRAGLAIGGLCILAALVLVGAWVIAPLERLTQYARAIRDRRAATLPPMPGRTLRELGTAFEEMRDALEGRQHVERYTQAMAHEIKAPLAAIRGAAELLEENPPPEKRGLFLGNILRESARIHQSVDRLLELSSLEARKALRQTETISVAQLLEEAAAALQPAFAVGGITLEVARAEATLHVRGERVLLREAIVNLLQNALDFTLRGGKVALAAEYKAGRVVVSVEDSGAGVPEYALERAFEKFYSLPRPSSGRKSTGLGLSLVREIAHLHGGEASLSNRSVGGARAELTLPAEAPGR